jgi:hypothetical protein
MVTRLGALLLPLPPSHSVLEAILSSLFHLPAAFWFSPATLVIGREKSKRPFWVRYMSGIFYIPFGWWITVAYTYGVISGLFQLSTTLPGITQFAYYSHFVYVLLASDLTICRFCNRGQNSASISIYSYNYKGFMCIMNGSGLLFAFPFSPLIHAHCIPL